MSGFSKGPNVSQYLANLNAIPTSQESSPEGYANFDEDLDVFKNTNLFDFDMGGQQAQSAMNVSRQKAADQNNGNAQSYAFSSDLSLFDPHQPLAIDTTFVPPPANFDPELFQSPQSANYPSQQPQAIKATSPEESAGLKRPYSTASPSESVEDSARAAAEEDKRRRNTAASARFRVKKKQREAALEKTAKDMTDKVEALQKRVNELEMENRWLKDLVVQKESKPAPAHAAQTTDAPAPTVRIDEIQTKKGVGTKAGSA